MRIGCEDDQAACNCLTDENSVKRVLVIIGKTGKLKYCILIQRQGINIVTGPPFFNKFMGWIGQRQFTKFVFDNNFPGRSNTQVNLIGLIGKEPTGVLGETGTARYDPQKSTGI
jgi:hypothetical protein